ncbi:MAG: hypothetical protein AVDCRST_MAG77-5701 [uncultured Chloroflexi bacterium]|uniref:Uncharacterized protein n=1 Tax=uncultured Chloroflexota bacterium TaxID=166587 RepID=A0A6J4KBM3_9CHLR|nr:MAG: hypothetical protein AVDCRST_MAG77-5701 [uncultured Chloroflexota bacterium]
MGVPPDVEPAVLEAGYLQRMLDEQGIHGTSIVTAAQERTEAGLALEFVRRCAGPAQMEEIAALAPVVGERLGGTGSASGTADGDLRSWSDSRSNRRFVASETVLLASTSAMRRAPTMAAGQRAHRSHAGV